ncbi:hypothetical protein ACE1CD_04315 [Aerosakkonema sp. BLCC-F183]|uniref:hypothetical protein n=1 Tax=Aerosakkonema sp. BLCC-F183 TaxID=3342834 RepID=UPI0035B73A3D
MVTLKKMIFILNDYLTGKMGVLVQPRTKGAGYGSTSRAFYARKQFVSLIINSLDDFD